MASDSQEPARRELRVIDNHGHIGKIDGAVVPDNYELEVRLDEREHIALMDAVGVDAAAIHCMEDALPLRE
jgi:hypothetical protein